MRHELKLALSFMRKAGKQWLPDIHALFSVLGIVVGTAFLIFTLVIYDGYVAKLETMIFGFFPQITIHADFSKPESVLEEPDDFFHEEETDDCGLVCAGQLLLDENDAQPQSNHGTGFSPPVAAVVSPLLAANPAVIRHGPVVFEQARFKVLVPRVESAFESRETLRFLGASHANGGFVPEIERVITNPDLLAKLTNPEASSVFLAQSLYQKLFAKDAEPNQVLNDFFYIDLNPAAPDVPPETQPTRYRKLQVAGVFRFGIHKIAENLVIAPLALTQDLFELDEKASFLAVNLTDAYRAAPVSDHLKAQLPDSRILVFHWLTLAGDLFQNLSLYRKIMLLVLLMSILITAFNIYNTLAITILERQHQIGVMMAMGLRKSGIYRIFLLIGLAEALLGTGLGLLTGIGAGTLFSRFINRELADFLPIVDAGIAIHPLPILFIIGFTTLICALTGVLVARKAAALDPAICLQAA